MSLDLAARVVRAQGRIALADAAARLAAWQRSRAAAKVEAAEVTITRIEQAADRAVRAARELGDPDWRQAGRVYRYRLEAAVNRRHRARDLVYQAEAKEAAAARARRIAQRERDELREQLARARDGLTDEERRERKARRRGWRRADRRLEEVDREQRRLRGRVVSVTRPPYTAEHLPDADVVLAGDEEETR